MTDSVFDQKTETTNVAPSNPDPFADKLKSIVGDDGKPKYETVDKAIEALAHSQAHIKQLEAEKAAERVELATLREKAAQAATLDEIVQRLSQNNSGQPKETPQHAGLSEAATVKALEDLLARKEAEKITIGNRQAVQDALLTKFGDKTREAVANKAKELGISPEELGSLSSRSPGVVLALFDAKKAPIPTTPPTSFNLAGQPVIEQPLGPPAKSLLTGAKSKDQADFMRKIKEDVYKRFEIET